MREGGREDVRACVRACVRVCVRACVRIHKSRENNKRGKSESWKEKQKYCSLNTTWGEEPNLDNRGEQQRRASVEHHQEVHRQRCHRLLGLALRYLGLRAYVG